MTTLERMQLVVQREFGFDAGIAIYMAITHFIPKSNHALEYGSRAIV